MRCTLLLLPVMLVAADPVVVRTGDRLAVDLGDGVRLGFTLAGDRLLGLTTAEVDGLALKSPETAWRPVPIRDRGVAVPAVGGELVLTGAAVADGAVVLTCRVVLRRDPALWKRLYLVAPDRAAAAADPAVAALRPAAEAAERELAARIAADPEVVKREQALTALAVPAETDAGPEANKQRFRLQGARIQLDKAREQARGTVLAAAPDLSAAIRAHADAATARGLAIGTPHRDYHRMPVFGLPAEISTPAAWAALPADGPEAGAGTLRWTIRPDRAVIAGWPWRGFASEVAVDLERGELDSVRWFGSWELGGRAAGTTVIAHRYRGLGGLEQAIAAGPDGAAATTFTTTEILPGAVGGAPVISPAPPATTDVNDRGYGLIHRAGAWIARLNRGAGAPLMDFQWRPEGCLARWPARQGAVRAVTEVFPGDRVISQTDEELAPIGPRLTTIPMRTLALVAAQAPHEARTRWREAEAHSRAEVAAELRFTEHPVAPAVGWNIDHNFPGLTAKLAADAAGYGAQGIRQVHLHQPGWINGRALREGATDGIVYHGGGDVMPYDWWPLRQTEEPWRAFQRACAAQGIASYVWIGLYNHPRGRVVEASGVPADRWAVKYDGTDRLPGSVLQDLTQPAIVAATYDRLEEARQAFGFQGMWIDSFQSNGHYRFGRDRLDPTSRAMWEILADWTRRGVGFTSESHAVPGLSCSIEVGDGTYRTDWWALPMTVKWYRGGGMPDKGTDRATAVAFRLSAGGAWACPDVRGETPEQVIPGFARLARERLAAEPRMRRPYLLPDGAGMLWLGPDDRQGVLFPLVPLPVPAGVAATPVLGGDRAATAAPGTAWAVDGADLLAAFALSRGPLPDPRIGAPAPAATYAWTVR